MKLILAGLAVLVFVSHADAEYRTLLLQLKQDNARKIAVAIYSDDKKEQRSAASVAEAVKVIAAMKGWGSRVGVYVSSGRAIPGPDLKQVLVAVLDNPWLDLEYCGRDVPGVVARHFLTAPPAAPGRDPEQAFRTARRLVAALEGKHALLKGVSEVKPVVERDEKMRLKSARLIFANNAKLPGKNAATARDDSRPFFYLSVQLWSGRSQSPPGNLHEFTWQGQTYQMWVRVYGSDAQLVTLVRKSIDEPLREPPPAKVPSSVHTAADVVLIAGWLRGHDPVRAFTDPFGDRKWLTESKDPLLYTDIPGVKAPAGMKAANYELVHARMQRIKHGHRESPAVVIVHSSPDDKSDREVRHAPRQPAGRAYYVEVAIGNLAWHWFKVVVRGDEKLQAEILWRKVS